MRRLVIIDSDDDDDECSSSANIGAISSEQSTLLSSSRLNTPDSGFTSPVISLEDDEGLRRPRKKMRSFTNHVQSQQSQLCPPSGFFTGTDPYVEIDTERLSTTTKNKRQTSPYVEVVSSQTSPFKPSSQPSIKTNKRERSPPRKFVKLVDNGRQAQSNTGRQAKLSMFFTKPAAKKLVKE